MPISNSIDHLFEISPKELNASLNILDESVISGEQKKYRLFVTVDASFIALALFDNRESRFVGLETFYFQKAYTAEQIGKSIGSIKQQSNLVQKATIDKVSVQLSHNLYTFVPAALFRAEDAEKYFKLNHPKKGQVRIENEVVKGFDVMNIFSVNENLYSELKKTFNAFTLHHHITSLLQAVRLKAGKDKVLHLHFRPGWVDVIIMEGKRLLLCNSFNYKSSEDAVYFILNVCEQIGLNPHSIETDVMGELEKESAINKLISKYIDNIHFSERSKATQFTYGFDKIPSHFYYSVFSHALCEL
jgi:hypothetical protein